MESSTSLPLAQCNYRFEKAPNVNCFIAGLPLLVAHLRFLFITIWQPLARRDLQMMHGESLRHYLFHRFLLLLVCSHSVRRWDGVPFGGQVIRVIMWVNGFTGYGLVRSSFQFFIFLLITSLGHDWSPWKCVDICRRSSSYARSWSRAWNVSRWTSIWGRNRVR